MADGCPLDCAKKALEEAGLTAHHHVRITNHGFEKGKADVTEATIAQGAEIGATRLSSE